VTLIIWGKKREPEILKLTKEKEQKDFIAEELSEGRNQKKEERLYPDKKKPRVEKKTKKREISKNKKIHLLRLGKEAPRREIRTEKRRKESTKAAKSESIVNSRLEFW